MISDPYQVGLLGDFGPYAPLVVETLRRRLEELGIPAADIVVLEGERVRQRRRQAPFVAIFFADKDQSKWNEEVLREVLADSHVILPVIWRADKFEECAPEILQPINAWRADDIHGSADRIVSVVLENFRLLRQERRLFISYRRDDSRGVALQLFEAFEARGFDVFLDTHSVPPAAEFQSVLWHRIADSDLVVLLDTPNFFESRWTVQERTRALATKVQILHLLWPGRRATDEAGLSEFLLLAERDFVGDSKSQQSHLTDFVVAKISDQAEALRARALAARHRALVDAFCDELDRRKLKAVVQPSRYITVDAPRGHLTVVPLIGVPSALRLHERYMDFKDAGRIWILYDERGLLEQLLTHLDWLNESLPLRAIRSIKVVSELDEECST